MSFSKSPRLGALIVAAVILMLSAGCNSDDSGPVVTSSNGTKMIQTVAPRPYDLNPTDDPQSIAEAAYIYAFPMLEFYRVEYNSTNGTQFNTLVHNRTLATPSDHTFVAPNNDTLYTKGWLDLRAEPLVLDIPPISGNRYYSFILIDEYTHVTDVIGSRTVGWTGGRYLIAGPDWNGTVPAVIDKVVHCESNYILLFGRTAVLGSADLSTATGIQDQYKLYPLSSMTGATAATAPTLTFPAVDATFPSNFTASMLTSANASSYKEMNIDFIPFMNFQLGRLTPVSSEQDLMAKFARIGIGPDAPFDQTALPASTLASINAGIASARAIIMADGASCQTNVNGWLVGTNLFGDRQTMEGRYRVRAAGALVGLFGNPSEEAVYMGSTKDSDGNAVDGSGGNKYTITFPAGQTPPADAFWSLTMYDAANIFLVANPINRYKIGSLDGGYTYEADGSLKIYIQAADPGGSKTGNWLPAPTAKFYVYLRIYCPKSSVLDGSWTPPSMVKTP